MKVWEALNIYNLHTNPEELKHYDKFIQGVFFIDTQGVDNEGFQRDELIHLTDISSFAEFEKELTSFVVGLPDRQHFIFNQYAKSKKFLKHVIQPQKAKKLPIVQTTMKEWFKQLHNRLRAEAENYSWKDY